MNYGNRLKKVQAELERENFDAFVSMLPNNVRYLSCTHRIEPLITGIVIPRSGNPVGICSAFNYLSRNHTAVKGVATYGNFPFVQADEKTFRYALNAVLKKMRAKKVMADRSIRRKAVIKDIVKSMRIVKDKEEASRLRKAGSITGRVAGQLNDIVHPGRTEIEIAKEIQAKLCEDANMLPFFAIVSAGNPEPHHQSAKKKIKKGDAVVCDFGAYYKGYCADMTRTVLTGNNPNMREIHDVVAEAQKVAMKSVRQGMEFKKADMIARDIINEYGYGRYFVHNLGHGVGLEVHEAPSVSPNSKDVAKKGMVFTIEPGIYTKHGSVRIEDTVLLGNKVEILTK